MAGMGLAMMGTGVAEGDTRAVEAARRAISSPLLEGASVDGARGVIINVTGGPDLSLLEVSEASTIIQEAAHEDANIIFGAVVDPMLQGRVKITVIATGFDRNAASREPMATPSQTPVDLAHYNTRARAQEAAPSMTVPSMPMPTRPPLARRASIDLPQPMAMAAGAENQVMGVGDEPSSPLDVPAFLRRQHDV
jgi:cell division protein FtsZ